jgi:DNA-3-methyladenine glycosylase I
MSDRVTRCSWAAGNELLAAYHDREWGVPVRDDRELFAKLVLDGFQAGLSWTIILRKRPDFLRAFDGLDPAKVARYTPARVRRLLADPAIVRNRLKVESAIANARAFQRFQETGAFGAFLWDFVGGTPRHYRRRTLRQIPARTSESERMSEALRRLGFRFVGPTICYAFMQAVGMVNDHLITCFRHRELGGS